jgi:hypothetical protein
MKQICVIYFEATGQRVGNSERAFACAFALRVNHAVISESSRRSTAFLVLEALVGRGLRRMGFLGLPRGSAMPFRQRHGSALASLIMSAFTAARRLRIKFL